MKKILVPTDLSELSHQAFIFAQRLARKIEATIHLLQVLPLPSGAIFDDMGNLQMENNLTASSFEKEKELAEAELSTYAMEKELVESYEVVVGNVEQEIIKATWARDVHLVVMGTHGTSGFLEIFQGSHSEKIVRKSPVPVICIKHNLENIKPNHIVLASDFDTEENYDFSLLKEFQNSLETTIHLLYINTEENFQTTLETENYMQAFVERYQLDPKRTTKNIYCDNSIEEGINNFCLNNNLLFIAIGTHQRKGLSRLWTRSISEEVINHNFQVILTAPLLKGEKI